MIRFHMIRFHPGRLALALSPAFLVAACASWCGPNTAQDLNNRMQVRLAQDIAAGRVALQPLPDGTRVILVDPTLFQGGGAELGDQGRATLGAVVQGLVAPRLLRIDVADGSSVPGGPPGPQAQAVAQFFEEHLLGREEQALDPQSGVQSGPVGTAPQGLTITVSVVSG